MTDPHMAGQRRENNQCEDCGDDIALTDVQGHYDGKCAKCREYRVYETDHIGTGKSFEVYDNERKKKESGFKHG